MGGKAMTTRDAISAPPWAWITARLVSFGALGVLLPLGLNLLGLALGWAVILIERGKPGATLAALWSVAAVLLNLVLYASLTGGVVG